MTLFRPCIDLHDGKVKQIVGGTLGADPAALKTNFVAELPAEHYAARYRDDGVDGGHVIKLGPGNDAAARAALASWPGGLHIGGGIDAANAAGWLDAGAGKIIVTSWLFPGARFAPERLIELERAVGRERLVVDLSCRARRDGARTRWFVAIDRWRTVTDFEILRENLALIASRCSELLVHAADVEGLCRGIDLDLVTELASSCPIPCTYAGGANAIADLMTVDRASGGRIDLTYGSALDLFGGTQVRYDDCVAWNRARRRSDRRKT
ncbi:MAG: phosphoribosylformimino-5-aminoimidazole carboxamide ribotide isomerase [Planctomycetes bacterium]|nr:phosphoribosylformimino-5-aminoimidazole carboxamide ribotide isomerase [Planctomycetota bacterium]